MNIRSISKVHPDVENSKKDQDHATKLVRQQRFFPDLDDCYIVVNEERYPVVDYSAFGIAIKSVTDCFDDVIDGVPFIYLDVVATLMNIRKVRHDYDSNNNTIIAFEITNDPIHFDKLEAIRAGRNIINIQEEYVSKIDLVPIEIKAIVYEIRDWFDQLSKSIEKLEETFAYTNQHSIQEFEETVTTMVADHLAVVWHGYLRSFSDAIADLPEDKRSSSIIFLREKISHLIHQSPFAERVYNKPLGYAGDFEMMNLIYRQETIGRSLFARCLQRYYIDEPAAQAVRNRADYLVSVIKPYLTNHQATPLHILSVACGPAMEWQKLLKERIKCDRSVYVDLLDQDEQALHYAQKQVRHLNQDYNSSIHFNYIHCAIKRVLANGLSESKYDLIYSAGLFDYLADSVCRKAAQRLFESVKPGGCLIIGNFNVNNPNAIGMEYALDWELIYRSPDALMNMFKGIGDEISIEEESLGINLFCVIRKKA